MTPSSVKRATQSALLPFSLLLGLASCGDLFRREPRRSQPALVEQSIGGTRISVRYNRPSARGRALFGGIVKYGDIWDPGADEATTIDVSHDVTFGGQKLPNGRYSVWAIPQPGAWTLILSSASDVPHVPYPEGHDVVRLRVMPDSAPYMEALAYTFPVADSAQTELDLQWGTTRVRVPILRR